MSGQVNARGDAVARGVACGARVMEGGEAMKAMLAGFAAAIAIAIAANFILGQIGFSSAERSASAAVRLR